MTEISWPESRLRTYDTGETSPAAERAVVAGARDQGIDALRGFAMLIMVIANMAPHLLDGPQPFWFRFWSSLAAPLFIVLSGLMLGMRRDSRPDAIRHALHRVLALLLVAALLDWVCWKVSPFSTFDVLYLIALLQIVTLGLSRWHRGWILCLGFGFVGGAGLLQPIFGYRTLPESPYLARLEAWLIDGWFPVFPWLGVGLLGIYLGRMRRAFDEAAYQRRLVLWALGLTLGGGGLWLLHNPALLQRGGYIELFYPPTLGAILTLVGVAVGTLATASRLRQGMLGTILGAYGRVALLLYVVHLVVIAHVVSPLFGTATPRQFIPLCAGHLLLLLGLAWSVRLVWPNSKGFLPRLLLG